MTVLTTSKRLKKAAFRKPGVNARADVPFLCQNICIFQDQGADAKTFRSLERSDKVPLLLTGGARN